MAGSEWEAKDRPPPESPASARWGWQWLAALMVVVGTVDPLVGIVRKASEPHLGHWLAWGLGVLATGVAALPLFAVVNWIFRREQSARGDDFVAMVYRPAILPAFAFLGALIKDFPGALTEWATWMFLGWLSALLIGAVLLQRRGGRAWSWWVAVPVGIVLALVALAGTAAVSHAIGVDRV